MSSKNQAYGNKRTLSLIGNGTSITTAIATVTAIKTCVNVSVKKVLIKEAQTQRH